MTIKSACGHFKTITKHRHKVLEHCIKAGIPVQGLLHDLSKYSLVEFLPGAEFYVGTRSPNELEREANGYSEAWMHHKGRNRHHFEYWTDYNPVTKENEPVRMPVCYVVEMFCDRVAASKIYMGDAYTDSAPLEYFYRGKARRKIHPDTSELLERMLTMLAEQGEEKTFARIRRMMERRNEKLYSGFMRILGLDKQK